MAPEDMTLHESLPLAEEAEPGIAVRGSSPLGENGRPRLAREANSAALGISPSGDAPAARRKFEEQRNTDGSCP